MKTITRMSIKAQVQTQLDERDPCHQLATELQQVTAVMDRCA